MSTEPKIKTRFIFLRSLESEGTAQFSTVEAATKAAWISEHCADERSPGSSHRSLLPGAARFAAALSMTRIQSFALGGVKSRVPRAAKVPISVVDPSRGLNHQPLACPPGSIIFLISTVMLVA